MDGIWPVGQWLCSAVARRANGIDAGDITLSAPAITDKSAQQYGNTPVGQFRYTAQQTVTVYSRQIAAVRNVMSKLSELGKQGIVITRGDYQAQTEYLFTRLNEVKPEMIEEATKKAREVAGKFAEDSASTLGKIKRASQGQFSITARDNNNPHITISKVSPRPSPYTIFRPLLFPFIFPLYLL